MSKDELVDQKRAGKALMAVGYIAMVVGLGLLLGAKKRLEKEIERSGEEVKE